MKWWNKDQRCYDVSFGTHFLSVYPRDPHALYIYISYVFRYTKDSPLRNVLPTLRSDLEVMQENGEATPLTPAPLSPAARRAELIWCMILPVPRHQSLTGIFFPETNWEKWGAIKDDAAHKRLMYITLKTGPFAFHLDFNKVMGIVPCFLYNMISSRSLKAQKNI